MKKSSSGTWRRLDLVWTDISEERIASIFVVEKSASEEPASASGCRLSHQSKTDPSVCLSICTHKHLEGRWSDSRQILYSRVQIKCPQSFHTCLYVSIRIISLKIFIRAKHIATRRLGNIEAHVMPNSLSALILPFPGNEIKLSEHARIIYTVRTFSNFLFNSVHEVKMLCLMYYLQWVVIYIVSWIDISLFLMSL
jgi:hypothetical protein